MKKRLLSMGMSLLWLFQSGISVYAQDSSGNLELDLDTTRIISMVDDTLNEEQKLKLISEVEEINSHGIQSDWLQDAAMNEEAAIHTYMLPNNVESVIACSETLDGAKHIIS